uniref:Uncharacterized protein n=1 Tax=Timema bartmani TaxID=61472 RepID=A0A7R9I8S8_9NEOP|nr:unnamed protein product [Timema bartmani]
MLCFVSSRGPNKYTRNWEDVEAYGKPVVVPSRGGLRRGGRGGRHPDSEEEFPPLVSPPNTPESAKQPDELQTVTYSNRVADRRGEPRNMKKEAFPPLQSDQNNHESGYRSEEMYSNTTSREENKSTKNTSINAWRGVNNAQGLEEEIVPSATNWKNSNNARVSDIRRALEENGGGSRRGGGSKPFNNRPLEDQEPSSEGSWRGKGQVKQASPAGTQVSST